LQFLTTGVVSEILSRIFFQTTNVKSYKIRKPLSCEYNPDFHEQLEASLKNPVNETK